MILYRFLNADKTKSASYVTDSFLDVNADESLHQFYITELREVGPEIVQAGVNIEIGMYTEPQIKQIAADCHLTLEKWSDGTLLETIENE